MTAINCLPAPPALGRCGSFSGLISRAIPSTFGGLLLTAIVVAATSGARAADQKRYAQEPEIAPAQTSDAQPEEQQASDPRLFEAGPKPTWIWGADANKKYVLKTAFQGGSQSARLKASCDNVMTLYVNGQRIASSSEWQTPVDVDVQKYIKPGENTLSAEVENQGGASGFVLKLALVMPDGKKNYVVTDGAWQAGDGKDAQQWVAARSLDKLGGGAWGECFRQQCGQRNARRRFQRAARLSSRTVVHRPER